MSDKNEGLPKEGDEPKEPLDPETPTEPQEQEPGKPAEPSEPGELEPLPEDLWSRKLPRKIADKYETIEQTEAAYVEAQKKMHEATAEAAQYRTFIQQQLAQQQATQQPVADPSKEVARFTESPQQYIDEIVQGRLGQTQQQLALQNEVTNFKVTHSDWETYAPAMIALEKVYPRLMNVPGRFEIFYQLAKKAEMEKGIADSQKDAYQQGQQSATDKEQRKAQTPTSKPGSGVQPGKDDKDMTADEYAKAHGIKEGPDIADKPANY